MANQKLSAIITVGAALSGSVKTAFGGLSRSLTNVKDEIYEIGRRQRELSNQRRVWEREGKAVDELDAEYNQLGATLDKLRAKQDRLRNLDSSIGKVGSAFADARSKMGQSALTVAGLATAAGFGFKKYFLDVAVEFERFQTILTTVEGSSDKAKSAMGWISEFAAKTPYDLSTVTEAFVQMRAYGLNPTDGLLKTLCDTSAAMGKDVMQAVEAVADAVNGENERLKEFGIKAAVQGSKIAYTYTDRTGKQITKLVDKSNRDLIVSTLQGIWNDKYAGAMDKMSMTWEGMVSNIGDQWTRFANNVMAAGVFDAMKGRLGSFLDRLNEAAADGTLQEWAQQTADAMLRFGDGLLTVGRALGEMGSGLATVADSAQELLGGWDRLGAALAAGAFAPTILSVGRLGMALGGLVAASGPIGWVVAALLGAAVIGVASADKIGEAWNLAMNNIKEQAGPTWAAIKDGAAEAVEWIEGRWVAFVDRVTALLQPLREVFSWMGGALDAVHSVGSTVGAPKDAWGGAARGAAGGAVGDAVVPDAGAGAVVPGGPKDAWGGAARAAPGSTPPVVNNTTTSSLHIGQVNVTARTDATAAEIAAQVQKVLGDAQRAGLYDASRGH